MIRLTESNCFCPLRRTSENRSPNGLSDGESRSLPWKIIEFDQDYNLGLAYILQQVILEAEGIEFTACNDFDGRIYLLYGPSYPWDMPERDISLKERDIAHILAKYLRLLTDENIPVDYHSPENGG